MQFSRRNFLQIGAIPFLGLSLSRYLSAEPAKKKKSVIFFHLLGGPSHIDTYDPKPNATEQIRGPYKTIATNVPGMFFSELFTEQAKVADRLCVVRSFTHSNPDHSGAQRFTLTGRESAANHYPAFGAVWCHLQNTDHAPLLPYVFMGFQFSQKEHDIGNVGILSSRFRPKLVDKDPNGPNFNVDELSLVSDLDESRLASRREILKSLDAAKRDLGSLVSDFDVQQQRAFEIIANDQIAKAFAIDNEEESLRNRYGRTEVGQRALLARRLVEAGVCFVSIEHFPPEQNNYGWDHHMYLPKWFPLAATPYDQAVGALISDLDERGLLEDVLVIAFGEFGRTPKLNSYGGRDHWPRAGSVLLAGNGIRGGQIYGSTDNRGYDVRKPVYPDDLLATIYQTIGYSPETRIYDKNNRPHFIAEGHPIDI